MLNELTLTTVIDLEDGQYVARCVELGTATFGDTFEEASANIREAVEGHLNALQKRGTLLQELD